MRTLLRLSPALLLFAVCISVPPRAQAEEGDEVAAVLDEIDAMLKAEDTAGLAGAAGRVVELYKAHEDSATRGKLRGALGKMLRDKDAGDARSAAVEALVGIEDPKNAWKEVSKAMPDVKTEEAQPLELAIVQAAGKMAQTAALKDLFELGGKAKDKNLARAAVLALGSYGGDKKNRVKVLEEVMDIALKTRPGQSTTKNVSQEAQERWGAVGPAAVEALNTLTGQKVLSFEDWEILYKDNKKRPQAIFLTDPD